MTDVKGGSRGQNLIELVLAMAIIVAGITTGVLFYAKSTHVRIMANHRNEALNAAQDKLQSIITQPFALIHKTPFESFKRVGTWQGCSCTYPENYDDVWYPPETRTLGGFSATLYTCVGQVEADTASHLLYDRCPDRLPDTGLRRIHVRANWTESNGDSKAIDLNQLVVRDVPKQADTAWTGSVQVDVCKADFNDPTRCDPNDPNANQVIGAEIVAFKGEASGGGQTSYHLGDKITNLSSLDGNNGRYQVLRLAQDDPYSIAVNANGFFPASKSPVVVLAGQTRTLYFILRKAQKYGSYAATEISRVDHVVISKVISKTQTSPNTEILELFNPTPSTVTIPASQIQFYHRKNNGNTLFDSVALDTVSGVCGPRFDSVAKNVSIPPQSFLLIVGQDSTSFCSNLTTPILTPPFGLIIPDVFYNASSVN